MSAIAPPAGAEVSLGQPPPTLDEGWFQDTASGGWTWLGVGRSNPPVLAPWVFQGGLWWYVPVPFGGPPGAGSDSAGATGLSDYAIMAGGAIVGFVWSGFGLGPLIFAVLAYLFRDAIRSVVAAIQSVARSIPGLADLAKNPVLVAALAVALWAYWRRGQA